MTRKLEKIDFATKQQGSQIPLSVVTGHPHHFIFQHLTFLKSNDLCNRSLERSEVDIYNCVLHHRKFEIGVKCRLIDL